MKVGISEIALAGYALGCTKSGALSDHANVERSAKNGEGSYFAGAVRLRERWQHPEPNPNPCPESAVGNLPLLPLCCTLGRWDKSSFRSKDGLRSREGVGQVFIVVYHHHFGRAKAVCF